MNRSDKPRALFVFSFSAIALATLFFAAPSPAHASASFVQGASNTAVTSLTVSATYPSATTSGDLLIAVVGTNTNSTISISAPAGWSTAVNLASGNNTRPSQGIFYKTANGTETTVTGTVTAPVAAWSVGIQIYEFSGSSKALHLNPAAVVGNSASAATASITTTQSNELVFAAVTAYVGTTIPYGWPNFVRTAGFASTGTVAAYGGAMRLTSAAGPTSTTATISNGRWVTEIVSFYDNTPPTIVSVTSTKTDGSYTVGEVIPITVNFSEPVTSSGNVTVTLETGSTDRTCTFTVTNATSGSCNYTVQAGDTTSDLTTNSIAGTISDQAGNAMTNFTPATNLAASKAIVIDTAAPAVTNVTANHTNGSFTVGEPIEVQVTFNEAVLVTNTPTLTLTTGTPGTTAVNYSGGSNSTTLSFNYVVADGDNVADLDYASTSALALAGGTIKDAAGNAAVLTLPTPGAAGSLGANKNIEINTHVPTITSVTSTTASGSYKAGTVIPITVNFSEPVTSTGSVSVTLETGGTDRTCSFSVSNATSGSCNYTVQPGDTSSDLTTNAILGTIKDSAGNTLINFTPGSNLADSKDIVIDTAAPTITSATSSHGDGSFTVGEVIPVTVHFSEAVTSTGNVTVTLETGATDRNCTFTVTNATFGTCNYTVQAGDTSSDLTTNAIAGTINDAAGNAVTDFTPGSNLAATSDIVIDTTAPTVSSTSPTSGATGVAVSSHAIAIFNEPMDGLTITSANFTLKHGLTSVSGTVAYIGGDAHFEPDADLDPLTTYTAQLTTGAKDVAGNALAAAYTWTFTTGSTDTTPPTVVSTDPASGATHVPVGQVVSAHFSEGMDTGTITSSSFTLKRGLTPVSGSVSPVGDTATFTPSSPLLSSTTYTATLTTDIKDTSGNALASTYSWDFTTADVIAPTVTGVSSSLADGAYTVGQVVPIQVTFTENVTYTGENPQITLTTGSGATTAVDVYTGSGTPTLTFNYTVAAGDNVLDLDYASVGALRLNGGAIQDDAGNDAVLTLPSPGAAGSLGANKDIEINTHIPTISSVTSTTASGTYRAGTVIPITVNFSEPVTSTGSVTVTLETGGTDRSCTFSVSNATSGTCNYTVQSGDASADLAANSILGTIKDRAGNAMTDFTPASNLADSKDIALDTDIPSVISTSPSDAATGVASNANISATFSEPMDATTLVSPATTFTLKQGLTNISGAVTYGSGTATFNPDTDLDPSTAYTATISTGAKDAGGNPMAAPYSWSFTTGAGPDLTPPTVVSTDPADAAVSVPVSQVVSVNFDEPMDPLTLNAGTFTLKKGLTAVSGSVGASGSQATFTPSSSLAYSTVYTATVTTGAKDQAGNALASAHTWSFTTAAAPVSGGGGNIEGTATTGDLLLTLRAAPGSLPADGGEAIFLYTVRNLGDAHIGDIAVRDDLGSGSCAPVTYVSGDEDGDGILDPGASGEIWTFTCKTAVLKSASHLAVASGTWNEGAGLSNVASTEVFVGAIKAAPGIDLYERMASTPLQAVGASATFSYDVVNVGDVPVSDLAFSGGFCAPTYRQGDLNHDLLLDPSETWSYTCTVDIKETTQRTIIVDGQAGDISVTAMLNTVVNVAGTALKSAGINLNVRANPIRLPFGGGTTVLTYQVTNQGDLPLTDVTLEPGSETCVVATPSGGDVNGDRVLDLHEKWTYTCTEHLRETEVDAAGVSARVNGRIVTDTMTFAVPVASAAAPESDSTLTGPYDPDTATANTPDIDTDKGLTAAAEPACTPGVPLKLADDGDPSTTADETVYYCGRDGRRYPFLNPKIYFSWFPDFSNVRIVDAAELQSIPLGASVTYRPGARMLKIVSDPKVYAVARKGTLRWLQSEALAAALYGPDWMKKVDDIPDVFFKEYVIGEPITTPP